MLLLGLLNDLFDFEQGLWAPVHSWRMVCGSKWVFRAGLLYSLCHRVVVTRFIVELSRAVAFASLGSN